MDYYVIIFRIVPDNSGIFVFGTFFLLFLLIYTWKSCGVFVVFGQTIYRCEEFTDEIVTEFVFRIIASKPTHFKTMPQARSLIGRSGQRHFEKSVKRSFREIDSDCRWSEMTDDIRHAVTNMSHLNLLIILDAN